MLRRTHKFNKISENQTDHTLKVGKISENQTDHKNKTDRIIFKNVEKGRYGYVLKLHRST